MADVVVGVKEKQEDGTLIDKSISADMTVSKVTVDGTDYDAQSVIADMAKYLTNLPPIKIVYSN